MKVKVETRHHPRLSEWHLRRALRWMNPLDLAGVNFIRLLPAKDDAAGAREGDDYLRSPVTVGEYVTPNPRAGSDWVTHINVYTRPFYHGIPSLFKYTPVATLRMAFVLAHEVGHHLIHRRGYVFEPAERYKPLGFHDERQERVADRYALELWRRMSARPHYRAWMWLGHKISRWYYNLGVAAWERGEYRRAAYYWFCAYCGDPENLEADRGYRQAVARVGPPPGRKKAAGGGSVGGAAARRPSSR